VARDRPTPSGRLQGNRETIDHRRDLLQKLLDNPGFSSLPENLQDFVRERHQEVKKYLDYFDQVEAVPPPDEIRSLTELQTVEDVLAKLIPPPDWADTDAGFHQRRRLDDAQKIRDAVERIRTEFQDRSAKVVELVSFKEQQTWSGWYREARKAL